MLHERRRDRLYAAAFYVALPALIFTPTYDRTLRGLLSVELVVGLWAVLFTLLGAGWLVHRRIGSRATQSVAVVQSYHCDFDYLGLPLVAATLGAAAGKASVILGIGALTTGLGWIAQLALPVALLLVGSSLDLQLPGSEWESLGSVVALKVLLMPILAWVAFTALGADPLTRNAGVVMLGAPTAVSTFIYATELGGDAEFASIAVFTTTLVSVGTLGVVLQLLL